MQVAKQWLCEILLLLKRMIVVGAIRSYRVSNWKTPNSDEYIAKMKHYHTIGNPAKEDAYVHLKGKVGICPMKHPVAATGMEDR